MTLAIAWPMTLPSISNERLAWYAKAKTVKAQRATTELALRAHAVGTRLEPVGHGMRLVVRMVRIAPRPIRDEHDNLRTAFKHVVDAIAAYFHIDDSDKRIAWEYAQERGAESSVRVEFRVEDRGAPTIGGGAPARFRPAKPIDAAGPVKTHLHGGRRGAVPSVIRNRPDGE